MSPKYIGQIIHVREISVERCMVAIVTDIRMQDAWNYTIFSPFGAFAEAARRNRAEYTTEWHPIDNCVYGYGIEND